MDVFPSEQTEASEKLVAADDANGSVHAATLPISAESLAKWNKTPRPRGRQARDPHAQSIRFQCSNAEELEYMLHNYLANPTEDARRTTLEFVFSTSAAFMVHAASHKGGQAVEKGVKAVLYGALNKTAVSVIDALATTTDAKEQKWKQKAIAKALVETVQKADGFRYSFHNNWMSKEDEASRFSYYCNDSTLNKGRAANEGAGMVGKKGKKPVYDCEGLLSIKFSATKQSLEVHYKHIPLHETYEERAPPPRKDSKRYKLLEIFHPASLPEPGRGKRKSTVPLSEPRPRKRRTTEPPGDASTDISSQISRDHSLAPLTDFLASADDVGTAAQQYNVSEPRLFPTENTPRPKDATQNQSPKTRRQKPPPHPGQLADLMTGEAITSRDQQKKPPKHTRVTATPTKPVESFQNVAAAAAAGIGDINPGTVPTPLPVSELELLKAKLLAAEQKIQRLEAEKNMPPGPPGWPPAPPVNGYTHSQTYPSYYPPHFQYPPLNQGPLVPRSSHVAPVGHTGVFTQTTMTPPPPNTQHRE